MGDGRPSRVGGRRERLATEGARGAPRDGDVGVREGKGRLVGVDGGVGTWGRRRRDNDERSSEGTWASNRTGPSERVLCLLFRRVHCALNCTLRTGCVRWSVGDEIKAEEGTYKKLITTRLKAKGGVIRARSLERITRRILTG